MILPKRYRSVLILSRERLTHGLKEPIRALKGFAEGFGDEDNEEEGGQKS